MPKKKKNEVKTYKQTVINAVILVVVLLVFVYMAIQLSRNFSDQVSTQRTQKVTDVTYSYMSGYIFKDASTLIEDGEIIHYLVSDGDKVGVGQAYAEIYFGTSIEKDARADTQKRLNELSDRIVMLEKGLEGGKNVSDLGSISDRIEDSYYAFINSVMGGNLSSAKNPGNELIGSLVDYSAITLSESAQNTLSKLKEERQSLISSIGGSKKTLVSDQSFTFFRDPDGYEDIFSSGKLDGVTSTELDAIIAMSQSGTDSLSGSKVHSSEWQLVIPASEAEYLTFKDSIGATYTVELLGSDPISLNMVLKEAITDEAGQDNSYLVFSSFDLAKISNLDRHQNVRVTLNSCTGYRIPVGAIHTVNEQDGVYILVGNMIEFRRITVIGRGEGYYIVNTYQNDYEEGSSSEIPYLNINDLIVISGRDLYDGKLLN